MLRSGNVYVGDFENDEYHGRGRYRNTQGYTYEGDFVRGKVEGSGEIMWPRKRRGKIHTS